MKNRMHAPKIIMALILAYIPSAMALNKCLDANGRTTYTDAPCPQSNTANAVTRKPLAEQKANDVKQSGTLAPAYSKYESALRQKNWNEFLDSLSSRQRSKMVQVGEQALLISKSMAPSSVTFVNETISASGESGILKIKGMAPSFMTAGEKMSYGTVNFVRENGLWKIEKQSWTDQEWDSANEVQQKSQSREEAACAGVAGRPESPADQDMLKLLPGEKLVEKIAVPPNGNKAVEMKSKGAQRIMFRASFNKALRCKYGTEYPAGMSLDGGKTWLQSYSAGQQVEPENGTIKVMLRNRGQETMNMVVVTSIQ